MSQQPGVSPASQLCVQEPHLLGTLVAGEVTDLGLLSWVPSLPGIWTLASTARGLTCWGISASRDLTHQEHTPRELASGSATRVMVLLGSFVMGVAGVAALGAGGKE